MKNPLSLDGLVSWLERQDPTTQYDYMSHDDCLNARYLRHIGLPVRSVGGFLWRDQHGHEHDLPLGLIEVSHPYPRTYGAALQRAREFAAKEHPLP